jgi:hypothetical protein
LLIVQRRSTLTVVCRSTADAGAASDIGPSWRPVLTPELDLDVDVPYVVTTPDRTTRNSRSVTRLVALDDQVDGFVDRLFP